jgi:hypothetical protein
MPALASFPVFGTGGGFTKEEASRRWSFDAII